MTPAEYVDSLHQQAGNYAIKLGIPAGGDVGGINDAQDAFRHAFSSAAMTRDIQNYVPIGAIVAAIVAEVSGVGWEIIGHIMDEHETSAVSNMDLHNNEIGREIGKRLGSDATDDEIAQAVKDALDAGKLIIKPEEPIGGLGVHFDLADAIKSMMNFDEWAKHLAELNDALPQAISDFFKSAKD